MIRGTLIQLVVCVILFVVTIGGYLLWYGSLSALSARSSELAAEISSKSDDVARTAAAKATLSTITSEEQSIRGYFVSTDEVVPFLEELQATGKSLGTKVDIASVSADMGDQPHLSLSLRIQGTFDAVMRTIGAIEYAPRDTVITDISLAMTSTTGGGTEWAATGTFVIGTHAAPKKAEAATSSPTTP